MKFWLTTQVYKDVMELEADSRREIEDGLNAYFHDKDYGKDIEMWFYLSIILPAEIKTQELLKYHKRNKSFESRLLINYDDFVQSDKSSAIRLVFKSLLRSVDLAKNKVDSIDFDFDEFKEDLTKIAKEKSWL